jgi:4-carboxymuconolactone decarboxylase
MNDKRRQLGTEMMRKVVPGVPQFEPYDPITEWTHDVIFGELWQRELLSMRERRLICIVSAAAAGSEIAVRSHVGGALDSGDFTLEELQEVCLYFANYYGMTNSMVLNSELTKRSVEDSGKAQ